MLGCSKAPDVVRDKHKHHPTVIGGDMIGYQKIGTFLRKVVLANHLEPDQKKGDHPGEGFGNSLHVTPLPDPQLRLDQNRSPRNWQGTARGRSAECERE